MSETDPGLSRDAFCYAGGVLGPAAALAFERRLGEDQSAREALADAVARVQALAGAPPLAPDPGYRAAVCRRLGGGSGWWRLLGPNRYPGHAALWALAGAAAALLLTFARPAGRVSLPQGVPGASLPVATPDGEVVAADPWASEVAEVWATLQNYRHLARAHEEVTRRKGRPDTRPVEWPDDVPPGSLSEFPQVMD